MTGIEWQSIAEVKQRMAVNLTIYGVLLALVGAGLPTLRTQAASPVLVWIALVLVGLFGLSFAVTLWIVVMKLNVELELPGVKPGSFQYAVQSHQLAYTATLSEVVINLAAAVDSNVPRLDQRRVASRQFRILNYVTLAFALAALAACSVVYVTTTPTAGPAGGKQMAEQTTPASQPAAQSTQSAPGSGQEGGKAPTIQAAPVQPSILAKPQTIALGEGVDPARSGQSVRLTTDLAKSGTGGDKKK